MPFLSLEKKPAKSSPLRFLAQRHSRSITRYYAVKVLEFLFAGLAGLARADDYDQVKAVCEYYSEYKVAFAELSDFQS